MTTPPVKNFRGLSEEKKKELAIEFFSDAKIKKNELCAKHNITAAALNRVIDAARADKIATRDTELLEIITGANIKFAESIVSKRLIPIKDIEALDKLGNSAVKRLALYEKSRQDALDRKEAEDKGEKAEKTKPFDIQINLD